MARNKLHSIELAIVEIQDAREGTAAGKALYHARRAVTAYKRGDFTALDTVASRLIGLNRAWVGMRRAPWAADICKHFGD